MDLGQLTQQLRQYLLTLQGPIVLYMFPRMFQKRVSRPLRYTPFTMCKLQTLSTTTTN